MAPTSTQNGTNQAQGVARGTRKSTQIKMNEKIENAQHQHKKTRVVFLCAPNSSNIGGLDGSAFTEAL